MCLCSGSSERADDRGGTKSPGESGLSVHRRGACASFFDGPSFHLANEGGGSESTPGWDKCVYTEGFLGNSTPNSWAPPLSYPSREEFCFLQSSIIGQIKPPLARDLRDLCKQTVQLVNQAPGSKVHTIKYLWLIYVQD